MTFLEFEKPIAELEAKIGELRKAGEGTDGGIDIEAEVERLQQKVEDELARTYQRLTPWQKTQVARHPSRPHFKDIVAVLIDGFTPLAGDRLYGEDAAIQGGVGRFRGRPVVVIGHEKGANTAERIKHNFGMAKPEGYRKAVRLIGMANRFSMPILTFVDTPGAFPGVEAEERGQAEAIAQATRACLEATVPFISVIVGEGGSGGAVALATANRLLMLEHSIYSVISPEGCASILWRTSDRAADAADALKITANDLKRLKVADRVIPEPLGGAHRDQEETIRRIGEAIAEELKVLDALSASALKADRLQKYRDIGQAA